MTLLINIKTKNSYGKKRLKRASRLSLILELIQESNVMSSSTMKVKKLKMKLSNGWPLRFSKE